MESQHQRWDRSSLATPESAINEARAINPFDSDSVGTPNVQKERIFGRDVMEVVGGALKKEKVSVLDRQVVDVCSVLSQIMVGEKTVTELPKCENIEVIQMVINQLENTPICLGWGQLPAKVSSSWQLFVKNTIEAYRSRHDVSASELVPLTLELPEWLQGQRKFDVLGGMRMMDATVIGDISGEFASKVEFCRVTVKGNVLASAAVGQGVSRSSFIFEGNFTPKSAFKDASNCDILIMGKQGGVMGAVDDCRIRCLGSVEGNVSVVNGDYSTVLEGIRRAGGY